MLLSPSNYAKNTFQALYTFSTVVANTYTFNKSVATHCTFLPNEEVLCDAVATLIKLSVWNIRKQNQKKAEKKRTHVNSQANLSANNRKPINIISKRYFIFKNYSI